MSDTGQYLRGLPVEEMHRIMSQFPIPQVAADILPKLSSIPAARNFVVNTKEEKAMNLVTNHQPQPDIKVTDRVTYGVDGETLIANTFYLGAVKGKRTADNSHIKVSSAAEITVPVRALTVQVTSVKPGQAIQFFNGESHQWGFVVSVEPSQKHEKDVAVRVLSTTNHIFTFEVAQELYVYIVPEYKDVFPATLRKKAFVETLLAMAKMQKIASVTCLRPYARAVYTIVESSKFIGLDRTNELLDVLMVKFVMQ